LSHELQSQRALGIDHRSRVFGYASQDRCKQLRTPTAASRRRELKVPWGPPVALNKFAKKSRHWKRVSSQRKSVKIASRDSTEPAKTSENKTSENKASEKKISAKKKNARG